MQRRHRPNECRGKPRRRRRPSYSTAVIAIKRSLQTYILVIAGIKRAIRIRSIEADASTRRVARYLRRTDHERTDREAAKEVADGPGEAP